VASLDVDLPAGLVDVEVGLVIAEGDEEVTDQAAE
jgi:hypothetical protein